MLMVILEFFEGIIEHIETVRVATTLLWLQPKLMMTIWKHKHGETWGCFAVTCDRASWTLIGQITMTGENLLS